MFLELATMGQQIINVGVTSYYTRKSEENEGKPAFDADAAGAAGFRQISADEFRTSKVGTGISLAEFVVGILVALAGILALAGVFEVPGFAEFGLLMTLLGGGMTVASGLRAVQQGNALRGGGEEVILLEQGPQDKGPQDKGLDNLG